MKPDHKGHIRDHQAGKSVKTTLTTFQRNPQDRETTLEEMDATYTVKQIRCFSGFLRSCARGRALCDVLEDKPQHLRILPVKLSFGSDRVAVGTAQRLLLLQRTWV